MPSSIFLFERNDVMVAGLLAAPTKAKKVSIKGTTAYSIYVVFLQVGLGPNE